MRILVLRALGLGDLLTAVPALRALRRAFPQALLELACPAWLHEPVLAWRLADRALDIGPLEPLPAVAEGADLAVNLHDQGPESTRLLLASRPGRLLAFRHAEIPHTAGLPAWRPGEHDAERWCRLLAESGIPADPERLALPRPARGPLGRATGYTILHSGAGAPARRWPARRWARLARAEREAGHRVVLTGSASERVRCLLVARKAALPAEDVLAGRTSVLELAALVARAGLVVCGDTGVAHLATAFGTPSVVLFGPASPEEWGPPPTRSQHRALWAGLRGDPHSSLPDPGLLRITAEQVRDEIGALRATLAARPAVVSRAAPGSRAPRRRSPARANV
ncbi:MAG TPA: glycosyltransferase family 9 protein [Gaiellaceae bacterium]|nr:glycosyltransferase family 9 protein [Gaiellaceae bacterium]